MPFSLRPHHPRAFTLVELLVVIAIIAVLIGLLLPAVQHVRESSSRTKCLNNMKQLGLALHMYHDGNGSFPQGAQWSSGATSSPRLTFSIYLYPYLEQSDLFNAFQFNPPDLSSVSFAWFSAYNETVTEASIKTWLCPSDNGALLAGNQTTPTPGSEWATGNYLAVFAGTDSTDAINAKGTTMTAMGPNFGAHMVQITDGTSNTLLLAEYVRAASNNGNDLRGALWIDEAGSFAVFTLPPSGITGNYTPNTTADDVLYHCTNLPVQNRPCQQNTSAGVDSAASRSMHSNGVNVLFCDGSSRFILNTISPQTWAALATIAGGEAVGNNY